LLKITNFSQTKNVKIAINNLHLQLEILYFSDEKTGYFYRTLSK